MSTQHILKICAYLILCTIVQIACYCSYFTFATFKTQCSVPVMEAPVSRNIIISKSRSIWPHYQHQQKQKKHLTTLSSSAKAKKHLTTLSPSATAGESDFIIISRKSIWLHHHHQEEYLTTASSSSVKGSDYIIIKSKCICWTPLTMLSSMSVLNVCPQSLNVCPQCII